VGLTRTCWSAVHVNWRCGWHNVKPSGELGYWCDGLVGTDRAVATPMDSDVLDLLLSCFDVGETGLREYADSMG
jgi:hypothetical protein